ncbi:hypothetical protein MMC19_002610 [Ptychographa xylographoides]|nr:hypothetical protein [Ptychographa xylographoides]
MRKRDIKWLEVDQCLYYAHEAEILLDRCEAESIYVLVSVIEYVTVTAEQYRPLRSKYGISGRKLGRSVSFMRDHFAFHSQRERGLGLEDFFDGLSRNPYHTNSLFSLALHHGIALYCHSIVLIESSDINGKNGQPLLNYVMDIYLDMASENLFHGEAWNPRMQEALSDPSINIPMFEAETDTRRQYQICMSGMRITWDALLSDMRVSATTLGFAKTEDDRLRDIFLSKFRVLLLHGADPNEPIYFHIAPDDFPISRWRFPLDILALYPRCDTARELERMVEDRGGRYAGPFSAEEVRSPTVVEQRPRPETW